MKLKLSARLFAGILLVTLLSQNLSAKLLLHTPSLLFIVVLPLLLMVATYGKKFLRLHQLESVQREFILTHYSRTLLHTVSIIVVYASIIFLSGSMEVKSVGQPLALILTSLFYVLILKVFLVETLRSKLTHSNF
jgi:hypothetical protein